MTPENVRVAAVFDGQAGGVPFFTPDRMRVIDPDQRAALLGYLTGAPSVVRAAGPEPDPLDPGRGPVVPVGYRSDGVWVWQDASAYYLAQRWVAPEDGLPEHSEAAGYLPPVGLTDRVHDAAARAALDQTLPRPVNTRQVRYYLRTDAGHSVENPGGMFRVWTDPHGHEREEAMYWAGRDRRDQPAPPFGTYRSKRTAAFASNRRNGEIDLDPVPTIDAARALDVTARRLAARLFPEHADQTVLGGQDDPMSDGEDRAAIEAEFARLERVIPAERWAAAQDVVRRREQERRRRLFGDRDPFAVPDADTDT